MPFEVVDHEQGTAAWLNWRLDGIGASDAPALMGENPWKSPARLFAEKCAAKRSYFTGRAGGGSLGGSSASRGTALEPQARHLYNRAHGTDTQALCVQSRAHAWLRASLDGIDRATGHLVEIKCGDKVYAHTAETNTVPGYYVGQLQYQLAVTGFPAVDFWVWLPGRAALLLTVARDEDYIARLIVRGAAFWAEVVAARA